MNNNSNDKVPNPLSSANSKATAVNTINRLAEGVHRANTNNLPAAADVATALQQRRPPVFHQHHEQQQSQQQRQPQATAVPGVFNFNPMMGAGMMGAGGPYNPGAAAAAGMNYFHPSIAPPFVLPANSLISSAAGKRGATTVATTAVSPAAKGGFPTHIISGIKRKSTAANSTKTTTTKRSTKKQRLSSSQPANTEALLIDLTTQQEQRKTNTTTPTTSSKSSVKPTPPRDPPGFEAFQRDPNFITSIMASRMKENGNSDRLLGPLARGIINMSDEEIFKLSNDENDATMRTFVTDVIMPLLGIDDHIAQSNYQVWQGYAHISSDSLTSLAKNFFYVRRSGMKAAVQVAFFEMKKNHQKLMQAQAAAAERYQQSTPSSTAAVAAAAVSARKIRQLELALKQQQDENAKMTKQIEEIYENDIADMRKDHKLHVEELKDAHRKEVKALKEEMEDMKCSHREFLGHYVEAAAEAVRFAKKDGKPSSSSLGRAISDL